MVVAGCSFVRIILVLFLFFARFIGVMVGRMNLLLYSKVKANNFFFFMVGAIAYVRAPYDIAIILYLIYVTVQYRELHCTIIRTKKMHCRTKSCFSATS